MKFQKSPWTKNAERPRSPQRLAAARRKVAKDQASVALFPHLAKHATPEAALAAADADCAALSHRHRAFTAGSWRKARRLLRELPDLQRRGILRWWQDPSVWLPRDPSYLLDAIRGVRVKHASYWRTARILRQFQLLSAGRLPRTVLQSIRAWD